MTPLKKKLLIAKKEEDKKKTNGIGDSIRISQEIHCHLYAGFFSSFLKFCNTVDAKKSSILSVLKFHSSGFENKGDWIRLVSDCIPKIASVKQQRSHRGAAGQQFFIIIKYMRPLIQYS